MLRLEPVPIEQVQPEVKAYFDADVERYGYVLGSTGVYAHNVPVLHAMKGVIAAYGETSSLPTATKALARTRVASLNGCVF